MVWHSYPTDMRRGGGKQKGASFERKVAVALSLWVTRGQRKDVFWRTAMSGGRATIHIDGDVRQCGDIAPISHEGHDFCNRWYIEIKHLRTIDLFSLLTQRGKTYHIWQKAMKEARKYNRLPMLIIRQNMQPTLVCIGSAGLDHLLGNVIMELHEINMYVMLFDHLMASKYKR